MKLVYIEWQDAHALDSSWHSKEKMDDFVKSDEFWVKNVGWVYKETKKYIVLCGQIVKDGEYISEAYGHVIKIPKSWIKKRVNLTKYIL